jgi:hypothetical protein
VGYSGPCAEAILKHALTENYLGHGLAAGYSCSMAKIKAHFDGRVLVLDEAADLPVNCPLEVQVSPVKSPPATDKPLARLARKLASLPGDASHPHDGAAQLDHYLYDLPKRP